MMADANAPVELLVCTTCRAGAPTDQEGPRPGTQLFEALQATALPDHVTLRGVECFSNCDHGCSVTLRGGAGRWTYVYGDMDPDTQVEEILTGVRAYAQTTDGIVPWRERPQAFRKQSIARIPPQE